MICFSTTKSFKKVLLENSKSDGFLAKSLTRHHFEENIDFWSKNKFWTRYYAKMKTFFLIWAPWSVSLPPKVSKKSYLKIQKVPVFELNCSQGIIRGKCSFLVKKLILNLILCQNENYFHNLGSMICFSTTKSFKKVLFEDSKSARFRAYTLARHHLEENINFW